VVSEFRHAAIATRPGNTLIVKWRARNDEAAVLGRGRSMACGALIDTRVAVHKLKRSADIGVALVVECRRW
jgi:hypothetical protein